MKSLLLVLFFTTPVFAGEWDCADPDVVFCMNLDEPAGTTARDISREGDTGTLNGGPAHVTQITGMRTLNAISTGTKSIMPPNFLTFTRTAGEDVTSALDAGLDFSGKPLMLGITFFVSDLAGPTNQSLWNYANGDISAGGWDFRIDNNLTLNFGFVGVADFSFNKLMNDNAPHSYCVWYDGSSIVDLFIDGKLDRRIVTGSGILSILGQLAIGRRVSATHGEFGGGVGWLRIKRNVTSEYQAKILASRYFDMTLGKRNQ